MAACEPCLIQVGASPGPISENRNSISNARPLLLTLTRHSMKSGLSSKPMSTCQPWSPGRWARGSGSGIRPALVAQASDQGRQAGHRHGAAAGCWRPFPRSRAAIPGLPGPGVRFGWASIAGAASIRSIPRPARCCAASTPTASSPASPGRGHALARHLAGRGKRHPAHRLRNRRGAGAPGDAGGHRGLGAGTHGGERFFCGDGSSGKLRVVLRKVDQDPA